MLAALAELDPAFELHQIVLTHSHRDHAGAALAIAAATGADVLAGDADAAVVEGRSTEADPVITDDERPFYEAIAGTIPDAPPVAVTRRLREGDDLGWDVPTTVIEVPGHTAGSIAIHLPTERLIFTGDNIASFGERVILGPFNVERDRAIESFGKLARLDIGIACFGHGDPVSVDAADRLRREASRLTS